MEKQVVKRKTCRLCGGAKLTQFLDLGRQPAANAFLQKKDLAKKEQTFPLRVSFCKDCSLVALSDVVDPKLLFGNYPYATSASKPLAEHFMELGRRAATRYCTSPDDLAVEIGSNDGVLLGAVKDRCRVLGVDPAKSLADIAVKNGIPTITKFFTVSVANAIVRAHGQAQVVFANNVTAHIDNLKDVFDGIKVLLARDGTFIFETHWVGNLIGEGGFDQIYHEHLSYFSLHALERAMKRWGLLVHDVELVPIHGQSLRVYVKKEGEAKKTVTEFLAREKALGLDRISTFHRFAKRVRENQRALQVLLKRLKKEKKTIAGYGAPAKGNTLLNYCSFGTAIVDHLIDTTPFKQGTYSPGMRIPVFDPEVFKKTPPDYALLLAWNYADKIIEKEKDFIKNGGRFIIPVPKPRIV